MKACGKAFLLQIEDPDSSGTFIDVSGVQANSLTLNDEAVDVTDKGSADNRELLPGCGLRSMSMSANGFANNGVGFKKLHAKFIARQHPLMRVVSELGDIYRGTFKITSLERGGETGNAETFSISMESSGAITYTPMP